MSESIPTTKRIIHVENGGVDYWLRGTTWTSERARANEFMNLESASRAMVKAKTFMKLALYRKVKIIEVYPE